VLSVKELIDMLDIDHIYEMLSCNNDITTQQKGIEEAKKIKALWVLILPILPTSSKDVWENCAKVLVSKTDKELSQYYYHLLTWLQDINWPGASIIYDRLSKVSDDLFEINLSTCLKISKNNGDKPWQYALDALSEERKKSKQTKE